ncbi:MAG: DUF1552 domain-containing protein [Pseudomonadota bacterium]
MPLRNESSGPSLSRRRFLRGASCALALPAFRSLNAAVLDEPPVARRLSIFYLPNGLRMPEFVPKTSGADYDVTPVLEPLVNHRQHFSVVSGLAHYNANALGDGPGAHGRSCAAFLTGAHPKRTEGADIYCGISADQVVANEIGQQTQIPSLELGIEPPSLLGSCDVGYSCTYTNTMSWRSPTAPMPVTVKPRDAFERLFGNTVGMTEAQRRQRMAAKSSVLDYVLEDARSLSKQLGDGDRYKLDEYLDSLRAVERRVEKTSEQDLSGDMQDMQLPAGIPGNFEEHVHLMIDLQVLALQSDVTRVVSLMVGRELSNRAYPEIGVPDSHHSLSHHGGDPQKIAKLVKINQFHLAQFAYLLDRLAKTSDGAGSLLDSTLVLGGASLGEPNDHDCMDLPALVAGGGSVGNQHIALAKDTPYCNLLLTLMQGLGMQADQFGDSTGVIPALDLAAV